MANHTTGAQRYNKRMDEIFARSKELNEKHHGKDHFGTTKITDEYQKFVEEWEKNHSISKAPSRSSWKKFYKVTA